jgi:hypothetical protein
MEGEGWEEHIFWITMIIHAIIAVRRCSMCLNSIATFCGPHKHA